MGWRWTFWIALIYAGLTIPPVFWLPETFAPVLLSRRAAAIRKKDPSAQVYAAAELEDRGLKQLATVVLTRPLRMLATELIVVCTCLYLALIYSIFYMSFRAFPHIFQDLYGLSPGMTGLCFLPIGLGSFLSVFCLIYYDRYLVRAKRRNAPWSLQEEYRRIPLACLGGPIFVFSLFWLGWTSRLDIPFAVPMLAGIPFGMGYTLIFMGLVVSNIQCSLLHRSVDPWVRKLLTGCTEELPNGCVRDLRGQRQRGGHGVPFFHGRRAAARHHAHVRPPRSCWGLQPPGRPQRPHVRHSFPLHLEGREDPRRVQVLYRAQETESREATKGRRV